MGTNYQEGHYENLNLVQAGWNVSQFVLTRERMLYLKHPLLVNSISFFLTYVDFTFSLWW
jgi:hypothetical protein